MSERDVSLVFQGGAMRVSYALGVVVSLASSSQLERIRDIHVSSAGVIPALALKSGDADGFARALLERISGDRFINGRRLFPVVDVDYLVDSVLADLVHLDDPELNLEPSIDVSITSNETGSVEHHRLQASNARELLRATMAIPVLYGRRVRIGDHEYVDGGVGDPIPVSSALDCPRQRAIAVVLTKGHSSVSGSVSGLVERTAVRLDPRVSSAVRSAMLGPGLLSRQASDWIARARVADIPIVAVAPKPGHGSVSRTCTDLDQLDKALRAGTADGEAFAVELAEA